MKKRINGFKTTGLLLLVFIFPLLNQAQSFNDKLFISLGFDFIVAHGPTAFSDVMLDVGKYNEKKMVSTDRKYGESYFGSGVGYCGDFRYNLYEFSDEMSVSVNVPVSLGFTIATSDGISNVGFLSFHIPAMAQFSFGNGATYSSSKNMGLLLGAGFEFNFIPIIASSDNIDSGGSYNGDYYYNYPELKKTWVQPVLQIGTRYWSRTNKLREISIRYGFGSSDKWIDEYGEAQKTSTFSFFFSYKTFLNY